MQQNQQLTINHSQETRSATYEYAGGHFKLTTKGIFFIGNDKEGKSLPPRWICSPLHVVAKTRDAKSGEWGRLLEWQDDDKVTHQWAMPLALLQGDSIDVRRELARLGLSISPSKSARDLLASYLQIVAVEDRARCVDKLGWHQDVYVTASMSIGQSSEKVVFQNTNSIEPALTISGTVEQWRDTIGRLASGNSRLVFAISTAFAPVLASMAGEDSGGFHIRGASSSGKTTALKVAASVWGEPDNYTRLWRSTVNGLEGLAAVHNDGLLILDELSQIDPKEAGEAAYLLANGQGKNRASKLGTIKPSNRWSLIFLSAGEESLTTLMARAGQRTNAGQEIRLADIESDTGCGMGIFNHIHEYDSPSNIALALKEAAKQYHGAVGIAWLKHIVSNKSLLPTYLADKMKTIVECFTQNSCSGQLQRVARRFALVAIAGELATKYGLTGWSEGEATNAAFSCFLTWREGFGLDGNREDRAILSQVRSFFALHGASRFANVKNANDEKLINRAGFYQTDEEGFRVFLVLTEVFKKELCEGYDPKTVIQVLLNAGWLKPSREGNPSQKPRIPGVGTPRLYVFTRKIWDDE
ncbi:DUF927 domain-containing protein [Legionella pneumophila serogroup 1]|uniref:DUF927 domain-containing protein n=1 Tax=Legionella pneumophila TaxID=446 RepID=UPI000489B5FE|nr:DUF927 domain-containing protein [Legionella pneumophila]AMV13834.1 hypothetical protein ULM_11510 [Legionella pneumophila]ANN92126.1 hypothetical protein A9P85_05590 [Legionella pneumophila]MCZ4678772.1 DUF927 domain-containing protein [Legionella pneumophila]MCZ4703480.1 DUF927 domain-containing protein [Legionella pneumophila]MCZ4750545.1 DUF927 domain-containing protein [Legionella pneumophila]